MRAEVAEHLRKPEQSGFLSPEEIDRRHSAAEDRLEREALEIQAVIGPPIKDPAVQERLDAEALAAESRRIRHVERADLLWATQPRSPRGRNNFWRRLRAMRVLRRRRVELFPEDHRQTP